MPPKGFKSITVAEEVYNYFFKKWLEHREEYRLKYGISSFSGFCTKLLYQMIEERGKKISKSEAKAEKS